ncbi:MAG: SprT-like domain-containing protein [Planctomycetota bacterium]
MNRAKWTSERLSELFQKYNDRYWDGKVPPFLVQARPMKKSDGDCIGFCNSEDGRIVIDVGRHGSDRSVRRTLLHEMCHAADKTRSLSGLSHGYGFWAEVENLLRRGAPFQIGFSEMPGFNCPQLAIPRRFPLCWREGQKFGKKRARRFPAGPNVINITEEMILGAFEDAALDLDCWHIAKFAVGAENGLVDVGLRPVNQWAERLLRRGRRRFENAQACRDSMNCP